MVYDVFCDWLQRFISYEYKCDVKAFFFLKKKKNGEGGCNSLLNS